MEKVMQYMWRWRLYGKEEKQLTDGSALRIIHPGELNRASGPDFFNAHLHMHGAEWAGNVELHVRASDWHRHGHDRDRAYDSVLLHVVGVNDTYVRRRDGSVIPQLHLPFSQDTARRYAVLAGDRAPLRCRGFLHEMPVLYLHDAVDSAAMERLQEKAGRVLESVSASGGDWHMACLAVLARALGGALNGEAMERLVRRTPALVAGRHGDNVMQLEALLIGGAGLLDAPVDEYSASLAREYAFLAHKYGLEPMGREEWKRGGVRPQAGPLRRLVYLARLYGRGNRLFSQLLEADSLSLEGVLEERYEGYWTRRLVFGEEGRRDYSRALGKEMLASLVINAVAPLLYAYGEYTGRYGYMERAQSMLEDLPAERNYVTRMWGEATPLLPRSAWESQGVLQLARCYCEPGNCLRCRIALQSMRKHVQ